MRLGSNRANQRSISSSYIGKPRTAIEWLDRLAFSEYFGDLFERYRIEREQRLKMRDVA